MNKETWKGDKPLDFIDVEDVKQALQELKEKTYDVLDGNHYQKVIDWKDIEEIFGSELLNSQQSLENDNQRVKKLSRQETTADISIKELKEKVEEYKEAEIIRLNYIKLLEKRIGELKQKITNTNIYRGNSSEEKDKSDYTDNKRVPISASATDEQDIDGKAHHQFQDIINKIIFGRMIKFIEDCEELKKNIEIRRKTLKGINLNEFPKIDFHKINSYFEFHLKEEKFKTKLETAKELFEEELFNLNNKNKILTSEIKIAEGHDTDSSKTTRIFFNYFIQDNNKRIEEIKKNLRYIDDNLK